jgi:hypothetical protein
LETEVVGLGIDTPKFDLLLSRVAASTTGKYEDPMIEIMNNCDFQVGYPLKLKGRKRRLEQAMNRILEPLRGSNKVDFDRR